LLGGDPICAKFVATVAKIKRNRRWPMFDCLPIPNWTRNRIPLLGDALLAERASDDFEYFEWLYG
jgi:hypothetical protein